MQDSSVIQTKLNAFFSTTQEQSLSPCRVQQASKKSQDKKYILCACSMYYI